MIRSARIPAPAPRPFYQSAPRQASPRVQPRAFLFPSGRYTRMNPLCRWFNLHLLAEPLPEPLRSNLIHAWMHPGRYNGNQALNGLHRQRYEEDILPFLPPWKLANIAQIELEVSRRIVEAPRQEITEQERSALLRSQGVYLRAVYAALAARLGGAAAQDALAVSILFPSHAGMRSVPGE